MSDLPTVKVSKCCDILDNLRIPLNSEEREKIKGNIPYCGANGIQGYISEYIFDEDLILLAEDGGNFDDYQTRPIAYRISGKSWVNNHAHVLRTKEGYDFSFVFYSLQHKNVIPFIKGGTRAKLNQAELREITIWDAPLPIQQRIGEILETIDNQIDATQALIDKYTAIKQGMIADLFSRGIDPETKALRPTFEEAPELYNETPLGMLPEGWEVIELENLLDDVTTPMRSGPFGSALLKEELVSEGIPLLGIDNIFVEQFKANYKRFVTERKFRELSRYAVRERDVVITIMGTVGRSCVIPESIGLALSSKHLWTMTFDKKQILPELVCWQLNHSPWAESWFRRESQGGVMDAIQSQTLKKLKLVVPPSAEQKVIYERYANLNNHIEVNQILLDKLKLQKTGLMQDLLTGKVPVPA
ncbi:restriction endonuclease subunit S [Thaumasiovibrio subtropicus]|uniref:restriction endonuclease subunit S n=1 Tax=Thaumasiovibrio subtropicus TaxID=1891207 RepID=UPI000B35ACEA|nr:restriction endonuclease subunit S [Thaumasiovibrio subtropicus]